MVSGNYFSTLQVGTAVGRVLTTDDDVTPLAYPVAVISDDYWTRQLRRSPDVLGQTIVNQRHALRRRRGRATRVHR